MLLVDARRLTGPNHLALAPLVIVEVALEGEPLDRALDAYLAELARMRASLGLPEDVAIVTRAHRGGAVFGYPAPIEELLACTEMSEWAAESACAVLRGDLPSPLHPRRVEVQAVLTREALPARRALMEAAQARGLPVLWDDTHTSVGLGVRSVTYMNDAIPAVLEIPWERLGTVPVALITGTNGKTTSSRLLAHVAACAGLVVGSTSTDGVIVGGAKVEEGDWTGPAAARRVLRDTAVELAVLETARGGILRRGLAVERCDVALLTNVGADHLGAYGIDDVNAMTRVKGVVAEIVPASGTVALNARDPHLAAFADGLRAQITLFADLDAPGLTDATRTVIAAHRAGGGALVVAEAGELVCFETGAGAQPTPPGGLGTALARIDDLPLTFGGAARYNVENILGVVAAALALRIGRDVIARGLATFRNEDNPGRGALLERDGVRVLLDFGHNPEGVRAVLQLVRALRERPPAGLPRGKLTVITGSAGDRSDADLDELARAVVEGGADRVLVRELGDYLRGREPGEVPRLLAEALVRAGMNERAVGIAEGEGEALTLALLGAAPGDFVALLVHVDPEGVTEALRGYSAPVGAAITSG